MLFSGMGRDRTNPIAYVISALQSRKNPLFSTLFHTFFTSICPIERTGNQSHPETLFAAMNTFTADLVILASAILTEKETPFLFPFFTAAHSSGSSFPSFTISGGFRSAHSFFAWESCPRTEGLSVCTSLPIPRSPLLMIPSIML